MVIATISNTGEIPANPQLMSRAPNRAIPGVSLSGLEVEPAFRGALCGRICHFSSSSLRSQRRAQPSQPVHRLPAGAGALAPEGAVEGTEAVEEAAAAMVAESVGTRCRVADQRTSAEARSRKSPAIMPLIMRSR